MKKSLLFCALAACAFTASANDYFTVKYEGKEIESGATIEGTAGDPLYGKLIYSADIEVVSKINEPRFAMGNVYYTGKPTMDEAKSDMATWGSLQVCFANGGVNGDENNCTALFDPVGENWATGGTSIIPSSSFDKFEWQIHGTMISADVASEYQFIFYIYDGADEQSKQIEDSKFVVNIIFDKNKTGVEAIEGVEAEAQYFDLQGRRVAAPEKGIYLVKRGNKVAKEVIR